MLRPKIYLPDLQVFGELISFGYAASLIAYDDMGVRYEVYMDNNEFLVLEEEDTDGL